METEIIKGCKLIGAFDGKNFADPLNYMYDKDWNQLMRVVEKITALGWQFQLNSYGVSNDARFINGENLIQNVAWSTPLLATFNVVVDFIKCYDTDLQPVEKYNEI